MDVPLRAAPAAALAVTLATACGEGLPSVPLDFDDHDDCDASFASVDASASEIQCIVESYIFVSNADAMDPIDEAGMNVPGSPVCCEVCALEDSADDACQDRCKRDLCERAEDEHYAAGQALGGCPLTGCGFNFNVCMSTGLLHSQFIDLASDPSPVDVPYGLRARCSASASDPARPDGLFRYLEGLGTIPGAQGGLASVEDVVGYCQEQEPTSNDGEAPPPATMPGNDVGADSSGGGTGTGDDGDPPEPPAAPRRCGPYAEERFWVRPTNNFGSWNRNSTGLGLDGNASYPVAVTGGGIAYTLLPCQGTVDSQCLRIDRLFVQLHQPSSGTALSLGLLQPTELIPISQEGEVTVSPGALRFAVRYEHDEREALLIAENDDAVPGHVDPLGGLLLLTNLGASSDDGAMVASMSLHADLHNTQPATKIIEHPGASRTRTSLTAQTFDAELDPIEHHWMIPGVGSWVGDHLDVELPAGRHAVILRAVDVHRSQAVTAKWITIKPSGA